MNLNDLFERTVFLFGAGASIDAGCLSSKGMLTDLKKTISSAEKDQDNFLAIYDFIIQSLIYQHGLKNPEEKVSSISNIEDFVAVLRQMIDREYVVPAPLIGNWNNKITAWEIRNEHIFKDFLDLNYEALITKWTKFNLDKAKNLVKPFEDLIRSDENFNLRIFSLNYDLIFESVFNSENEQLVDVGFSQKRWVGDFDDPENMAKLKLYKLHGSTDWYFDNSNEEVKQGMVEGLRPLIVFGSGPKIQSYDPFLSLLGGFRNILKTSNLFVVVGYSFQDKYINNILIQSLNSGLNKKMLVVDPAVPDEGMAFIEKVESFQNSKSMNELISLTRISPDRIILNNSHAVDFFKEYLNDNAQKLKDLLQSVEQGDKAF